MSDTVNNNFSEAQFWRAFQFVSGELSESAEVAFEEDLVSEAGLNDAVVEATRLTMLLNDSSGRPEQAKDVRPATAATSQSSRSAAVIVMATVTACCVLMVTLISQQNASVDNNVTTTIAAPETELIVDAWVDSAPESADDASESEQIVAELDVPDWMLAAVELSALDDEIQPGPDQG